MEYPKHENAKWAQVVNAVTDQYAKVRKEALEQSAALGYPVPSGPLLENVLAVGLEAKQKLTEANAKLYQDERERLFKLFDLELKLSLGWAKLSLKAYQQGLLNRLAIEEAEAEAAKTRARADLEYLNSEIESRQADIIWMRAAIEAEINYWRRQLVEAERLSLDAEAALIQARMETAEEKLKTIEPIYEVIAAQELVIKAEMKKAEALEKLAEAEGRVAAIKKEMIPYYLRKAEAREQLAEATIKEAEVEKARIELGYQKIALKDAQEAAEHDIRQAEVDFELAQEEYVRAEKNRQVAHAEMRTMLQQYQNQIQESILALKLILDKMGTDFKLDTRLKRMKNDIEADIVLLLRQREYDWKEFLKRMETIEQKALSNVSAIHGTSFTFLRSHTLQTLNRYHRSGAVGMAGGAI